MALSYETFTGNSYSSDQGYGLNAGSMLSLGQQIPPSEHGTMGGTFTSAHFQQLPRSPQYASQPHARRRSSGLFPPSTVHESPTSESTDHSQYAQIDSGLSNSTSPYEGNMEFKGRSMQGYKETIRPDSRHSA